MPAVVVILPYSVCGEGLQRVAVRAIGAIAANVASRLFQSNFASGNSDALFTKLGKDTHFIFITLFLSTFFYITSIFSVRGNFLRDYIRNFTPIIINCASVPPVGEKVGCLPTFVALLPTFVARLPTFRTGNVADCP